MMPTRAFAEDGVAPDEGLASGEQVVQVDEALGLAGDAEPLPAELGDEEPAAIAQDDAVVEEEPAAPQEADEAAEEQDEEAAVVYDGTADEDEQVADEEPAPVDPQPAPAEEVPEDDGELTTLDGAAPEHLSTWAKEYTTTVGPLTAYVNVDEAGVQDSAFSLSDTGSTTLSCYLDLYDYGHTGTLEVVSSHPKRISVPSKSAKQSTDGYFSGNIDLNVHASGPVVIRVTYTNDAGSTYTVRYRIARHAHSAKITGMRRVAYNKAKIAWKSAGAVTGYFVERIPLDEWGYEKGSYKRIKTVKGATSATVEAAWNKAFRYRVVPYVKSNNKVYASSLAYGESGFTKDYTLPAPTVTITGIAKKSADSLKVAWKAYAGASRCTIYRSTNENYGYKKLASVKPGVTSYVNKVKPGVTYYYKVVAVYPNGSKVTSPTVGHMIAVSSAAKTVTSRKSSATYNYMESRGEVGSFVQNNKLYLVDLKKTYGNSGQATTALVVTSFTKDMKRVGTRTIKLPAYDVWGGFYHGPDGNNYVIIGYSNPKESKTKVVIKVIKYDANWKKGKVASIKGGASNVYPGIYGPFAAATVSCDMQGSTLYLLTGRTMFETSDGLHHQSCIAFSVDTKTMKAKEDNVAYVSHSFDQRVRFKDGSIYLMNHGDAYPRCMALDIQDGYGTSAANTHETVSAFGFIYQDGNYTGATLGDMEVGTTNVLSCGVSVPHNYAVAGIKGDGYELRHNVYLTITNRVTGKNQVKWLTSFNPKTSKVEANVAKMVKITDNRFGILYSVGTIDGTKETVYYVVVDNAGKQISKRTYAKLSMDNQTRLTLMNGSVWWTSSYGSQGQRLNRIPAL